MRMSDNQTTTTETTVEQRATLAPGISAADIADAAANPSSFSVEGLSQTNRPLSELIEADKHLRKRALLSRCRNPLAGLVSHLIPPGTCDR